MSLNQFDCVSAYVAGWRDVVVLSHGRKWLMGFTAATLERVKLPAEARVKPLDYPLPRLAKRLRRNARTYKAGKEVTAAIAKIGQRARSRPTAHHGADSITEDCFT